MKNQYNIIVIVINKVIIYNFIKIYLSDIRFS